MLPTPLLPVGGSSLEERAPKGVGPANQRAFLVSEGFGTVGLTISYGSIPQGAVFGADPVSGPPPRWRPVSHTPEFVLLLVLKDAAGIKLSERRSRYSDVNGSK